MLCTSPLLNRTTEGGCQGQWIKGLARGTPSLTRDVERAKSCAEGQALLHARCGCAGESLQGAPGTVDYAEGVREIPNLQLVHTCCDQQCLQTRWGFLHTLPVLRWESSVGALPGLADQWDCSVPISTSLLETGGVGLTPYYLSCSGK